MLWLSAAGEVGVARPRPKMAEAVSWAALHGTTTVDWPEPPPLAEDLEAPLRRLRLPHIRRTAPGVIATARAQRWEPAEVLRAMSGEELAGRERSSLATRRAAAAFPTGKTFEVWEPEASSIPGLGRDGLLRANATPHTAFCRHRRRLSARHRGWSQCQDGQRTSCLIYPDSPRGTGLPVGSVLEAALSSEAQERVGCAALPVQRIERGAVR